MPPTRRRRIRAPDAPLRGNLSSPNPKSPSIPFIYAINPGHRYSRHKLALNFDARYACSRATAYTALPRFCHTLAATGAITPQAAYELDSADIIAVGDNRDGIAVYAVSEVSETIANHDLTRARQRAATLNAAVQADTRPVVIGKEISADHRERAAQQDIAVILLNEDDDPL